MGASELHIRRTTARDGAILADLAARTFKTAYAAKLDTGDLDRFVAATFSPDRIREEMRDPACRFLLAYEDGKAVGYAMLREVYPPQV